MSERKRWTGVEGSIWRRGVRLTPRVTQWEFSVERPHSLDQLSPTALRDLLASSDGHFVIDGGGPPKLGDAVRQGELLTLHFNTSAGRLEAEITVDPTLSNQPDVVVELFLFKVTGDIRLRPLPE